MTSAVLSNRLFSVQTSFDDFVGDETLKRATVRSLEIIGEATKKIPADIKLKWSVVQWKFIAGMRDKLIHDYFGINYNIVWDVIQNKLPMVKETIVSIIEELEKK